MDETSIARYGGVNTWRAGCDESRTSGSEGGPGKPTSRKADRAPRLDPYIMGAFNRSAIVTVVERQSRFLLLGDLPDGHDAQSVYECLLETVGDLPDLMRRSLTWDQGREMAQWPQLQIDADVAVFFCDPHSPWQRPSNEHMNGLLRQYFPKGTDLNKVSYAHLQHVAAEMNGRPRKILNWRTPAEVYTDLVATAA